MSDTFNTTPAGSGAGRFVLDYGMTLTNNLTMTMVAAVFICTLIAMLVAQGGNGFVWVQNSFETDVTPYMSEIWLGTTAAFVLLAFAGAFFCGVIRRINWSGPMSEKEGN